LGIVQLRFLYYTIIIIKMTCKFVSTHLAESLSDQSHLWRSARQIIIKSNYDGYCFITLVISPVQKKQFFLDPVLWLYAWIYILCSITVLSHWMQVIIFRLDNRFYVFYFINLSNGFFWTRIFFRIVSRSNFTFVETKKKNVLNDLSWWSRLHNILSVIYSEL